MIQNGWSRRQVMAATGAALAMSAEAKPKPQPLTTGEVIARIKGHVGVPWRAKTVDGIIVGDETTKVTGIATAMMANYDMVKAVVASGKNMLISHEPTFWSHQEDVSLVTDNQLYKEKLAFIRDHKLTVFHFHDHFHALKPVDGVAVGMNRRLGWTPDSDDPRAFTLPQTTLGELAKFLRLRLKASTMRVIGKPETTIKRARSSWGYIQKPDGIKLLDSDADVVLVGETWEWELQEYAKDLVSSGRNKALIVIGHINSEQWGMEYCAEWMRGFIKEVPIQFLEMDEPYWAPAG